MTNITFEGDGIAPEKLPKPVGWRILVGPIKIEEVTKGGILLMEESVKSKEYVRFVAKVLATGPSSYEHSRFQGGIDIREMRPKPWVRVGDIILVGQYAGQIIPCVDHHGNEHTLKLMNDDEVLGIIPDISAINV